MIFKLFLFLQPEGGTYYMSDIRVTSFGLSIPHSLFSDSPKITLVATYYMSDIRVTSFGPSILYSMF